MHPTSRYALRRYVRSLVVALGSLLMSASAIGGTVDVFHADSLAGPMREVKKAYEASHPGVTINLTSGVSRDLAARILKGDACDVFAPSSPAVIDTDLMGKKIAGTDKDAASWYVVFSANEMVIITAKGNPLGIRRVADLAQPQVKFVRVTGSSDLATARTLEFLKRALTLEGSAGLMEKISESAPYDPAKPATVPDVVNAVKDGRANAGIVYYSAAVAAKDSVDAIRFPESVNMNEAIRNAATVPGTAKNPQEAIDLVAFLVSEEAQKILKDAGQPPIVPATRKGAVPAAVK